MKLKNSTWLGLAPAETIARFGPARLVRKLDGRHELIGGTPAEHSAACEWCSLFAPEVVFAASARQEKLAWPPRMPSPNKFLRAVRALFLHPAQTLERDAP